MTRPTTTAPTTRRDFLATGASCTAHVMLMTAGAPLLTRRLWAAPRGPVVAQEPWGSLHAVGEGVWALISDPLADRTTLSNGGIVAGRDGVVVIEAFASDAGATWMAEQARRLTGRWPTHVVLTHHHGDHTGGLAGYVRAEGTPAIETTAVVRDLTRRVDTDRGMDADTPKGRLLADVVVLPGDAPSTLDLGGRSLTLAPRDGHTDSDVTIALADPSVVFCGDLVWHGMFPNYVDATPSRLTRAVADLVTAGYGTYVPGHGPLADGAALARYYALLHSVEEAARAAIDAGRSAEEAGAAYSVPDELGEWMLFNPGYFARAIGAWMRELEGSDATTREHASRARTR